MTEHTDAERLDWLDKNAWPDKLGAEYRPDPRRVFPFHKVPIREAIDKAMALGGAA